MPETEGKVMRRNAKPVAMKSSISNSDETMRTGNPVKISKRRIPQSTYPQKTVSDHHINGDSSVEWRHFRASITEVARKFRSPNRKSDLRTSDKLLGFSTIPIDMEEVNPTPNVEIIGLEGMEDDVGKDVGREVEEVEGDCEPYKKKQRKKSSIIWQEMTVVRLENGEEKVQCNHCNIKLKKQKDGTTTQYKRHLDNCIKRRINLSGQRNICVVPSTQKSESVSGV
nr:zinc finger BED domain-containing protein RICESLEEPER 2-like [Ipomoea batatas]